MLYGAFKYYVTIFIPFLTSCDITLFKIFVLKTNRLGNVRKYLKTPGFTVKHDF